MYQADPLQKARLLSCHTPDRGLCKADDLYCLAQTQPLTRAALGQDALQGAAVHVQPSCGFRHIAIAQLIDPLDMFPAHAIGAHWIFWRRWQVVIGGQQRVHNIGGIGRF